MRQIDKETYGLTMGHLTGQILEINKELNSRNVTISNLEKLISQSLKKLGNISKIWASSDFQNKRRLQKTLFPDGIFYNAQKHEYLTRNVNSFVQLVSLISDSYKENKNGNSQKSIENSLSVAGIGILSNKIVDDFLAIAHL